MDLLYNNRIQIIIICASIGFLYYISRKIITGKLREEYSIIWIIITSLILIFSIWRNGIELISGFLGIHSAPNLIFTFAIFFIYIYLIHLSIVNTKQQASIKALIQKLAILENEIKKEKQ